MTGPVRGIRASSRSGSRTQGLVEAACIVGLTCLLAACAEAPNTTSGGSDALPARLLFASERDGTRAVYHLVPGDPAVRLSPPGLDEVPLAVSPDGRSVVVGRAVETDVGPFEQLVLYRDGALTDTLTVPQQRARNPTWDGNAIVFESDLQSFSDLYRWQNGALERLTEDPAGAYEPNVAPDGRIVFVSSRDGQAELYVLDGDEVRRLPGSPRDDWAPQWAPDGQQIVFASDDRGRDELYLVRPDGTDRRRLGETRDGAADALEGEAAWSPNGRAIAYATVTREGHRQLWRLDLDGMQHTALTDSVGRWPTWSPDGTHIAYVSAAAGDEEIYVVDEQGLDVRRVTHAPGRDERPLWTALSDSASRAGM